VRMTREEEKKKKKTYMRNEMLASFNNVYFAKKEGEIGWLTPCFRHLRTAIAVSIYNRLCLVGHAFARGFSHIKTPHLIT